MLFLIIIKFLSYFTLGSLGLCFKIGDWLNFFDFYVSVLRRYIPIYIQQDATLHSLLYLETALHILDGTSTHHQERIQLHLQHLILVTL